MSSQIADKSFATTFVVLMSALVLLGVVLFMVAALFGVVGNIPADDGSRKQAAALERIKPVAQVSFAVPKPAVAVKLSGSEVYNKVCAACHATGVTGSPKTGAKDQWEPRFAQGLDTLVNHGVNGIRAMPAKGGDPSLTEANIKDAIVYMLGESGIKVAVASAPDAAAPAAAPASTAPAAAPGAVAPPPVPPAPLAPVPPNASGGAPVTAPVPPPPLSSAPTSSPPAAKAPASAEKPVAVTFDSYVSKLGKEGVPAVPAATK